MIDAMLAELRCQAKRHPESIALETVFIGGGTPTQLNPNQMGRLVDGIRGILPIAPEAEWTMEANPEDVDRSIASQYAQIGINRISFGVQSFDSKKLQVLERGHSSTMAADAVWAVADSIENISLDLIFAAPGEGFDQWQSDLDTALGLPIKHLSTYALTIEKGTSFWNRHHRGDLDRPDEDLEYRMYQASRSITGERGFGQYEISSFAAPGYRCRHNIGYWRGQPWYAVGPSAARFVDGVRSVNHASVTTYLKRIEAGRTGGDDAEKISRIEYAAERFAFGIRMLDGVDVGEIAADSGIDVARWFAEPIDRCIENRTVVRDGQQLRLTNRGILYGDAVAREFLGEY